MLPNGICTRGLEIKLLCGGRVAVLIVSPLFSQERPPSNVRRYVRFSSMTWSGLASVSHSFWYPPYWRLFKIYFCDNIIFHLQHFMVVHIYLSPILKSNQLQFYSCSSSIRITKHSRLRQFLMKYPAPETKPTQGWSVRFKDSKNVLHEILANRAGKGRAS